MASLIIRKMAEQLGERPLIVLPPRERLLIEGLPDLRDAGRAHRPRRQVELQAGRLPVESAGRDQPPRLGLEVVHKMLVVDLVYGGWQHPAPVVHQAVMLANPPGE